MAAVPGDSSAPQGLGTTSLTHFSRPSVNFNLVGKCSTCRATCRLQTAARQTATRSCKLRYDGHPLIPGALPPSIRT